jgi:hypothetical protein
MQPIFEVDMNGAWDGFTKAYAPFCEATHRLYRGLMTMLSGLKMENVPADRAVSLLAIASLDDFNDVVLLCSMGRGFGAAKLLRPYYERVVTLSYLSANPDEVQDFIDYTDVHSHKILLEGRVASGRKDWMGEDAERIEKAFDVVKARFQQTDCKKCRTTRLMNSWTKKGTPELAQCVSENMRMLYFNGFLLPTHYIHTTFEALVTQIRFLDNGGVTLDTRAEKEEAHKALGVAHVLLLQTADVINKHFVLGRIKDLEAWAKEFVETSAVNKQ